MILQFTNICHSLFDIHLTFSGNILTLKALSHLEGTKQGSFTHPRKKGGVNSLLASQLHAKPSQSQLCLNSLPGCYYSCNYSYTLSFYLSLRILSSVHGMYTTFCIPFDICKNYSCVTCQ